MKKFIIDKNDDGQRLDKFMHRVMPNAKDSDIFKSLRKKKVRVNGKHQDKAYRLKTNDEVCMYINDELFTKAEATFRWQMAPREIDVIYEDKNILLINKPSGMPSQDTDENADSLESRMRAYLYNKGEIDLDATPLFIPSLCHRIDRNTSGIVIAAKNAPTLRILNEKIKSKEIRKFYLCETESAPTQPNGKISGWLVRDEKSRKMVFYDKEVSGGVRCETVYRTIKKGSPALVEAELLTGRTHQIRVGLSHIGCSLLGDVKYGAKRDGKNTYQHLIAYKVIFDFKESTGELEYLKGREFTVR